MMKRLFSTYPRQNELTPKYIEKNLPSLKEYNKNKIDQFVNFEKQMNFEDQDLSIIEKINKNEKELKIKISPQMTITQKSRLEPMSKIYALLNPIERRYLHACLNHIQSQEYSKKLANKYDQIHSNQKSPQPWPQNTQEYQDLKGQKIIHVSNGQISQSKIKDKELFETKEVSKEEIKEEKVSFEVKLISIEASNKLKVIKELRTLTGLGLKESKELVEKIPNVLASKVNQEKVDSFKEVLEALGCKLEIV